MASSSILGGSISPEEINGKDVHSLGPSDNSDSGSDAIGAYSEDELSSSSDAAGTGERASVDADLEQTDSDILPDKIQQGVDTGTGLKGMSAEDKDALSEVEELVDDTEEGALDDENLD